VISRQYKNNFLKLTHIIMITIKINEGDTVKIRLVEEEEPQVRIIRVQKPETKVVIIKIVD